MLTLDGNTSYSLTIQQDKLFDGTINLTLSLKPVQSSEKQNTTEISVDNGFKTMADVAVVLSNTPQTPLSQTKSPDEVKENVSSALSSLQQTQPMWGANTPTQQLTPAVGHPMPVQTAPLQIQTPTTGVFNPAMQQTLASVPQTTIPVQTWGVAPQQAPTQVMPVQTPPTQQWGTPQATAVTQPPQEHVIAVTLPVTLPVAQPSLPPQQTPPVQQTEVQPEEAKEEKTKRTRTKKEKDLAKEDNVINYGNITVHQGQDGTATFKKGEELLMIQHPKIGEFVSVEIYPPMYQVMTPILEKYNAAGDTVKNCGVMQLPESVIATEIIPVVTSV